MANKRRDLIAGNWKMNLSSSDAGRLVSEILNEVDNARRVGVLVCPPFTSIQATKSTIGNAENVLMGAQNFDPEKMEHRRGTFLRSCCDNLGFRMSLLVIVNVGCISMKMTNFYTKR
jgi:triosephosphate isomerase